MRYFLFFVSILLISSCALQDKSETKQVRFKNPIFENTWEPLGDELQWLPYNEMKIYPDKLEFNMKDHKYRQYMADCKLLENEQFHIRMYCLLYTKGFKDEAIEQNIKFQLEWNAHNNIILDYRLYDDALKSSVNGYLYKSKEPTTDADLYRTSDKATSNFDLAEFATETKQEPFKNPVFENTWRPMSPHSYNAMKIYPDKLEFLYTEKSNINTPEEERYTADCKLLENEQTYIKMHCFKYKKGFKDEAFETNIEFSLDWREYYTNTILEYKLYDNDSKNSLGFDWYISDEPTTEADLSKTRDQ